MEEASYGSRVMVVENTNIITGSDNAETLNGIEGNDSIEGKGGNDSIYGNNGDDTILAGAGDDIIYAEKGNDYIENSSGTDTFHFNLGDGKDIILNKNRNSKIVFGEEIEKKDLSFSRKSNDLIINIAVSQDQITVKDYFSLNNYDYPLVKDDWALVPHSGGASIWSAGTDGIVFWGTGYRKRFILVLEIITAVSLPG